jgi:hypothetical protein
MLGTLSYRHFLRISIATVFILSASQSQALILYDGDNSANLTSSAETAPQVIFDSIAKITNSSGTSISGSAVYLRGKYLLTANHVSISTHVTFDGSTFWERDAEFTPIRIGPTDMKLIKLIADPDLPDTELFQGAVGDTLTEATLIGWGVGRDPNVADSGFNRTNIWEWGANNTATKRWGTNQIAQADSGEVTAGYSYDHLITFLNSNAGNNEAAATQFDSGSGLFIQSNGSWKLVGLTAAVSTINGPSEAEPNNPSNSTFGLGTLVTSDRNFFVRIGSYLNQIETALPDTTTYEGWLIDHSLYDTDALEAADTDQDGLSQLMEFAFGGDPNQPDVNRSPSLSVINEGAEMYLEISFNRPSFENGVNYLAQTTTDLSNWPDSGNGVEPTPQITVQPDGTETWTYRRSNPISGAEKAFMRIRLSMQ